MSVYFVTGKLGNGKTLIAISKMLEKVNNGLPIATNVDLFHKKFTGRNNKTLRYIRLPDKPTAFDLECIGNANPTYDESKNGALVLDECGTWFNARNWNEKGRAEINDWFLHARKLGWDVFFIVQDIEIVDSQARKSLAEHTVFCRRLDNLHIPFFGTIYKLFTGKPLRLPRIHVGKVVYGHSQRDPMNDRWVYRGTDIFNYYDTKQCFSDSYPHGPYSVLPQWHIYGRYLKPRGADFIMRLTKIIWRKYSRPSIAFLAFLLGISITALAYHEPASKQLVKLPTKPLQRDISLYEKLQYDGWYQINKVKIINFQHPELGKLNQHSPIFAGVKIQQLGDCSFRLTIDQRDIFVTCKDKQKQTTVQAITESL